MMLAEYALAGMDQVDAIGRRLVARQDTRMPGRVGNEGPRSQCRISDLSSKGARLHTAAALAENLAITVTLPGQKARGARVVWCEGHVSGCMFDEPLDDGVVATLTGIYATDAGDLPIDE